MLLDVSGSMRSAFGLDDTRDTTVERAHAIITSIINIVKTEVGHHKRVDEIFASAFGLSMRTRACDLIALLDIVAGPKDMRELSGYEALAFLLWKHGAGHAQEWVKEHLNMKEAEDLYKVLCFDQSLIPKLIELLPSSASVGRYAVDAARFVPFFGSRIQKAAVHNSDAYQKAKELIEDEFSIVERAISKIHHPKPKKVEYVSNLLDDLNLKEDSSHSSRSLQSRIRKLIEQIKPYIYGGTPMCEAIKDAVGVFRRSRADKKVLFILSDGEAEEGDPRQFTQELADLGVTAVTCYLTDEHIANQKCLLDRIPSSWPNGKAALFEMSSTMQNVVSPVTHLVDAGWELPSSGECRLFVQANSLDVVDELCEAVVARLTHPCNALVDVLQMVPYNEYINQTKDGFKAKKQKKDEGTCYAIAVAAVFRLAMQRIFGREGDYPQFTTIRNRLIREFGKDGADTRSVIAKVAPEYRLHFKEVDEDGARQALNHRRPVVA